MSLEEVIMYLCTNMLVNFSKEKQAKPENLVITINEGILSLHNQFNVRNEQATIVVPEYRHTFTLSNEDPAVIMASFRKLAVLEMNKLKGTGIGSDSSLSLIEQLRKVKLSTNKQYVTLTETKKLKGGVDYTLSNSDDISLGKYVITYPEHLIHHTIKITNSTGKELPSTNIYDLKGTKSITKTYLNTGKNIVVLSVSPSMIKEVDTGLTTCLKIQNVHSKGIDYAINDRNVFTIGTDTLYFPNCYEGQLIYVEYKPMPRMSSLDRPTEEIDLPNTLLDCLYAFVGYKLFSTIESYRQFYPNAVASYNNEIQKAISLQAVPPESLTPKHNNISFKGFC